MSSLPQMSTYTQEIGFGSAISRTHYNGGGRLWMRNKPATDLVGSMERGECYRFSRKVQFIGAKRIIIKKSTFLWAYNGLYYIEGYGKDNPQYSNTSSQASKQDVLQRGS